MTLDSEGKITPQRSLEKAPARASRALILIVLEYGAAWLVRMPIIHRLSYAIGPIFLPCTLVSGPVKVLHLD